MNSCSFVYCVIMGKKVQMTLRHVVTYACDGQGMGTCNPGSVYDFFDCTGAMVAHNDLTTTSHCN